MAIKANLVVDQGATFSATIDLTDVSNNVFNLTGYTVAAQMRKNYASSTAVNFVGSHSSADGEIFLSLTANTTSTIEPGRYLYDVEITSSGGTITRVVEGIVTVTPGITRI
jgi:hypothetical protein